VFLQLVDEMDDYEKIVGPGGLLELAKSICKKGQARGIGLSGHDVDTARRAVEDGVIDVLMFPVNMSWDSRPGRSDLFRLCARENIGLVAMKPFTGGQLFSEKKAPTPAQAIGYVLDQQGVSTVVPGVKNGKEISGVLEYLTVGDERDYTGFLRGLRKDIDGMCVYCNHCLPCPSGIDIGGTLRLADSADVGVTPILQDLYRRLPAAASTCTECGVCTDRCPFGVDVIAGMKRTVKLFENL
jgi:predicted aldo/keto reductase-like oxidoreductase